MYFYVNKKLNPSNIYFSTAMLQRPSGKLSVLGFICPESEGRLTW